jgi:hypothetical protein
MKSQLITAALAIGLAAGGSHAVVTADALERSINLRSHDGPFVVAQDGGGSGVRADSDTAGAWETFTLVDLDGGDLLDGDSIAFRASNGSYLQAENGGGGALTAAGSGIGGFETFRIFALDNPGGTVDSGAAVAILASDGASFLSAENGGGAGVAANGGGTGGSSTFQFLAF